MLVDTESKLAALVSQVRTAVWVALDTEADSLHAYPEKVCLMQLATPHGVELVDTLARVNLRPLLAALQPYELIMHGADYDLRLLHRHFAFVPRAVFDTMLAARLLGRRQFSLGDLVHHYLGVTLEKGPQKANWAQRPLTPRMDAYARNDARYLKPLADRLRADLEARQRLGWHREMCARLVAEARQPSVPDPDAMWRVKGSFTLEPRALAVLRELWVWREQEAIGADRPPFFILPHDTLVAVARAAAAGQPWEDLLPPRMFPPRRAAVRAAVARALALPPAAWPARRRPQFHYQTEAARRRLAELRRLRDAAAARLGIDPALIASRSQLSALAEDWERHAPELMAWQRELLTRAPRPARAVGAVA